jgi:monoamine oxidase
MAKIIYARRTAGGRCCSFYGRSGVRSMKRNDAMTGTGTKSSPMNHSTSNEKEPSMPLQDRVMKPTKTITSGNIKSNKQVEAQKTQMNQVIRKLENVNVKRKNITFDI